MMRDPGQKAPAFGSGAKDRAGGEPATTIAARPRVSSPTLSRRRLSVISAVMPTYGRWDVAVERGEGPYLWATDGRKFLDFTSGIAVTGLGHCHPHLVDAITEQAKRLWHTSNLFQIPGQERLAQRLVDNTFADTVFFGNSGAEACELAIKVARKYQSETGHPERYRIVACEGSFHGRTLATLAAAGNEAYLKGFGPAMDGFDHVAFGNLNEMRAAIGKETAAIFVEPIQGEGGVRAAPAGYLKGLREIADEFGLLLVYDEVQSGMGRTGKLFAHEWEECPARCHGGRQGARRRLPDRRLPGDRARRGRHGRRHPRLDLWRQPAGGGGRQRGPRRDAGARLLRTGRHDGEAAAADGSTRWSGPIPSSSPNCAARVCCSASAASCRPRILSPSCARTASCA